MSSHQEYERPVSRRTAPGGLQHKVVRTRAMRPRWETYDVLVMAKKFGSSALPRCDGFGLGWRSQYVRIRALVERRWICLIRLGVV